MSWVAAVEIGASDAALWLGMFATAVAIVGSVAAITVKVFRYIDGRQDAYEWVRAQMAENGRSVDAGTVGQTQRDVLDSLVISLARLDVNQREQGQKLAAAMRSHADHVVWAAEQIAAFREHLANHPKDAP